MNILKVNTFDHRGGAEQISHSLFEGIRESGHSVTFLVGWRALNDPDIVEINPETHGLLWKKTLLYVANHCHYIPTAKARHIFKKICQLIAEPAKAYRWFKGYEEHDFPLSKKILHYSKNKFDIAHLHNLHGNYFDLRVLSKLSKKIPVLLTLHDEWIYTGHCAYSLDCERWKQGCGECPYLELYPAVRIDNTSVNWNVKRNIYSDSRLYISTPSRWLLDRVKQSMLANAMIEGRVINNGIDLDIFRPSDKYDARKKLNIDKDAVVLVSVANYIRSNSFKDYKTAINSVLDAGKYLKTRKIIFIAVGEYAEIEYMGNIEIHFVQYQQDKNELAYYYQAADIYLHAVHCEVWGLTITEALACGTPVVATAVGGIGEQVFSLDHDDLQKNISNLYPSDEANGILVEKGNYLEMSRAIRLLLENRDLMEKLSINAANHAIKNYSHKKMLDTYMSWYEEILDSRHV